MSAQRDRDQSVRDLIWTLTSPSLVQGFPGIDAIDADHSEQTRHWLETQQQHPDILLQHLQQREKRFLGSYFEALWEYWLRSREDVELLAVRQQFHWRGSTLGELDFLLRQRPYHSAPAHLAASFIHQEIAVKFYLGVPNPGDQSVVSADAQWIGPNAIDRLDLKLSRLRQHQFAIANHPQVKHLLQQQGIAKLQQQLVMKGYLFYPLGSDSNAVAMAPPQSAGSEHLCGFWLRAGNLDVLEDMAARWLILDKACWLAPAQAALQQTLTFVELKQHAARQLLTEGRPRMLCGMKDSQSGTLTECLRGFVVPDSWPGHGTSSAAT